MHKKPCGQGRIQEGAIGDAPRETYESNFIHHVLPKSPPSNLTGRIRHCL